MTGKQTRLGTATRTCTSCGHAFTTWPGDDEPQCNPCIIASFGDPATMARPVADSREGARDGDR